jgi:hypothetical protein
MDDRPKRRELFRGQLDIQYTRLANNGFGITPGGIPRFLRYLDAGYFGAHHSLQLMP